MVQCGDMFGNQKFLHAEGGVSGCIVAVQNPGFAYPQDPSLLTNCIYKANQDLLIKKLINSLFSRYKLIMHQALVVKE